MTTSNHAYLTFDEWWASDPSDHCIPGKAMCETCQRAIPIAKAAWEAGFRARDHVAFDGNVYVIADNEVNK